MESSYSLSTGKTASKGKETLFRVTYRNQISLVQIADNKANMIIGINSVIISVVISIISFGAMGNGIKLNNPTMLVPVVMVILTCLCSAVFAIQAARPYIILNKKKKMTPGSGRSSMLFFGNIASKSLDTYLSDMNKILESYDLVYEQMIIDIFNQGKVLDRKFFLLGISYIIFMYGLIFSVLAFLGILIF